MLLKKFEALFSRGSGKHVVTFTAEQEFSDTQSDVSIINTQN
jgi:hypothetical protein